MTNDADLLRLAGALAEELRSTAAAAASTLSSVQETTQRAEDLIGQLVDVTGPHVAAAAHLRAGIVSARDALHGPTTAPPCDTLEHTHSALTIELWKQTIAVQQHFNDLELRIRNFAITAFVAVIGATAFAFKENLQFTLGIYSGSLATALLVAGIVSWLAFYFMDRWWYHMLLVGSVVHGLELEKELEPHFPNAHLTRTIGKASPIQYGFAVGVLLAISGVCTFSWFAPAVNRWLAPALFGLFPLLLILHFVTIRVLAHTDESDEPLPANIAKRRQHLQRLLVRIVLLGFFVSLGVVGVVLWQRGSILASMLTCCVTATIFIAAHEYAALWPMRSNSKVDAFYLAGILVYIGVAIAMQHAGRPAAPFPVTATTSRTALEVTTTNPTATTRRVNEITTTKTATAP
jgi:hypothetical protein